MSRSRSLATVLAFTMTTALSPLAIAAGFVDVLDTPAQMSPLASKTLMQAVARAGSRLVAVGQRGHIVVSTDGGAGPYIMVSLDQLDKVVAVLGKHEIPHWVDHNAVSVDGRPAVAVINLGRQSDPHQLQEILDEAA